MTITLLQGDCLQLMQDIPSGSVDAVIADPPYGCNNDCDYTRFGGGLSPNRNYGEGIINDDKPFDPAPFMGYRNVILWGYQFWAQRAPAGTILVWLKKRDNEIGHIISDCELAWQKGNRGVWVYKHVWNGFDVAGEARNKKRLHPTQKPVELMMWCIERVSKPGDTILDPYMGSGTTGVACVQTGRSFIGIEIDEGYFKIAEKRIAEAQLQVRMEI